MFRPRRKLWRWREWKKGTQQTSRSSSKPLIVSQRFGKQVAPRRLPPPTPPQPPLHKPPGVQKSLARAASTSDEEPNIVLPILPGLPQRQTLQTRRIIFGRSLSAFLSLTYIYIYRYIYVYVCACIYVCVCVYTWRPAWGCSGVDGVQGGIATLLYVCVLSSCSSYSKLYSWHSSRWTKATKKKSLKKHWSTNRQKKTQKKDYARCWICFSWWSRRYSPFKRWLLAWSRERGHWKL